MNNQITIDKEDPIKKNYTVIYSTPPLIKNNDSVIYNTPEKILNIFIH